MATFGETLKRERELREISLREISDATKINVRYLEALEQNRFDALPGGLFNKGFIRAYATYIGVDGEAMVNSYLHEIASREEGAVAQADVRGAIHRPAEAPRRRADAAGVRHDGSPAGAPVITFAPPAPKAAPPIPEPIEVPHAPRPAARDTSLASLAAAVEQRRGGAPAVSGIEDAGGGTPSRVLSLVLGLVAVAGVLFLAFMLVVGRSPSRSATQRGAPSAGPSPAGMPPQTPAAAGSSIAGTPTGAAGGQGDGRGTLSEASLSGAGPVAATPRSEPVRPHAIRAPGFDAPDLHDARAEDTRQATLEPAPAAGMALHVEVADRTWVMVFCDGREIINWVMRKGEEQDARCLGEIRVSAADAAAVRLMVNGAACPPLGDPGTRVHGYTIRSDDFRQICSGRGRGDDARP